MRCFKKILKNRLKVLVIPLKQSKTVTVTVAVQAGSRYENEKNRGISHFLEHMCFKGTNQRPTALSISHELDSLGANSNAWTTKEQTAYYAKSVYTNFDKIFDVVSDIYLDPLFPEIEIEKEKGVVIEEINMYEDDPRSKVYDLFDALVYQRNPLACSVLGEKKHIRSLNRDKIVEYRNKYYIPQSTVIIVSGNVEYKQVVKKAEKAFGQLKRGKKTTVKTTQRKQSKPAVSTFYRKTDQSHIILGNHSFGLKDKDITKGAVLSNILGGSMSSRLFQKLREEMGVCYYVSSYNSAYSDDGYFKVFAGVDNKRLKEVLGVILSEMRRMKDELVSDSELNRAKKYLVGNLYMDLESSDDLGNFFGQQEILNLKVRKPSDVERDIRAVSREDIQKVAQRIFRQNTLNLAVVGPVKNGNGLPNLLRL
jgi:predicted Zn-dependent peptidase